ncbi:hypothetical protein BpHYR1_042884 [Brachionus plicatilis]|uniref:Uncharacterized protein n=1 Tax=Brachionus plicatilis TaxID=10195 RepID=A0A3M7RKV9_BRAPC|nr:hypothetical protein BpHYR1_042884 [Brachionus plicatilis]
MNILPDKRLLVKKTRPDRQDPIVMIERKKLKWTLQTSVHILRISSYVGLILNQPGTSKVKYSTSDSIDVLNIHLNLNEGVCGHDDKIQFVAQRFVLNIQLTKLFRLVALQCKQSAIGTLSFNKQNVYIVYRFLSLNLHIKRCQIGPAVENEICPVLITLLNFERPSNHLDVACIHHSFICLAQNSGLRTVCFPLSLSIKSFTNLILFKQGLLFTNIILQSKAPRNDFKIFFFINNCLIRFTNIKLFFVEFVLFEHEEIFDTSFYCLIRKNTKITIMKIVNLNHLERKPYHINSENGGKGIISLATPSRRLAPKLLVILKALFLSDKMLLDGLRQNDNDSNEMSRSN